VTLVTFAFITQAIKRVKRWGTGKEVLMRVSKEQAAQNRQKLLTAAARLFREQGISATGVDAITKDTGLTHGAFYSQFGSKEAVTAEAIQDALSESRRRWKRLVERHGRDNAFLAIVKAYLSRDHRDVAGKGCVVAALGGEIGKQPKPVRDAFTREFNDALDLLAEVMPGDDASRSYDDAIVAFAAMAGAVILARAVDDEALSDRILKATAEGVLNVSKDRPVEH
jgi:TetR/AcrR family transcriptional repressor of nem operon